VIDGGGSECLIHQNGEKYQRHFMIPLALLMIISVLAKIKFLTVGGKLFKARLTMNRK
jgi:hypothetical protein